MVKLKNQQSLWGVISGWIFLFSIHFLFCPVGMITIDHLKGILNYSLNHYKIGTILSNQQQVEESHL